MDEIRSAVGIRQAQAEAETTITAAKQGRDALLIDGTARQLADADAAMRNAGEGADRIASMVEQLELRLAPAERAERQAVNATMLAEWEAADRAKAWCDVHLADVLETIKAGVVLHNASIGHRRAWLEHAADVRTSPRRADRKTRLVRAAARLDRRHG